MPGLLPKKMLYFQPSKLSFFLLKLKFTYQLHQKQYFMEFLYSRYHFYFFLLIPIILLIFISFN